MPKKHMSGYCRATVFSLMVLLALCFIAASVAPLSNNLVVSKVTQTLQIPATIVPVYATCPAGYYCMTDADAMAQLGTSAKYSDAVCGYKQSTATMAAVIRIPQYCVKKVETQIPVSCPTGCSCMLESDAKAKFGSYSRCSDTPCPTVVTGSARLSAYCFRQGTITTITPVPTCPAGCLCISEATAKAKGGSWTRCSADICGYEQSTATFAAAVQVPKYCMKQQETTPVCPDGCTCISDEDARLKGLTVRCENSQTPCGYRSVDATSTTAAKRIPLYCYKISATPTTPQACPPGCYCLKDTEAKDKFGSDKYTRCQEAPCSSDQTRFCFKPLVTVAAVPQVCPQGCYCVQEAVAKAKFGPNNYTRCSADICGYDPSATSANGIPRYCFKPTITVTPAQSVCPQGCTCTTDEVAKEKGLTLCRGVLTSCAFIESNQQVMYCFEQVPSPVCVYDYQKNTCTGTCQQGYTCGMLASKKDAAGTVDYAVCGCTGQPTTGQCTFDTEKQNCTGTCQSGASCAILGKKVDEKTGEVFVVCGCPQQTSCTYNYDKDACVGTCTATGDACQLNTIYRDPTTGKVTYAGCHCKGRGEVPETCTCDTTKGTCTGSCADGRACTMSATATDNAGKNICTACECRDTCVLTANNECSGTCANQQPCTRIITRNDSGQEKVSCGCVGISQAGTPAGVATRQPGIFDAIASFFSKLFGGK